jgi:hypothetical protein
MRIAHAQIEWNHWRIPSVAPDEIIRVAPEPDAPRGRKARLMADYWRSIREVGYSGILWQDPDIVCDPDDIDAMRAWAGQYPQNVLVAPHKLWPASTMRPSWVWAHGHWDNGAPVMSQQLVRKPEWFALGLTYTPAVLLELAAPHMFAWQFGQVDSGLSAVARQHKIPGLVVGAARPKHLHFYPREDDASWRPGIVSK